MNIPQMVQNYNVEKRKKRDLDRTKEQKEGFFWPSQGSAELEIAPGLKMIVGKCQRALYWRWTNVPQSNPPDAKAIDKFAMGDAVEQIEIVNMANLGILMSNVDPKKQPKGRDLAKRISWKLDGIVYDQDYGIGGMEIKSMYGHWAHKEVFGGRDGRGKDAAMLTGFPKLDNLIQVMIYLSVTKLPFFHLLYVTRDEVEKRQFTIRLDPAGFARVTDPLVSLDDVFKGFSIHDIYARMQMCYDTYIAPGVLAPCDFRERLSVTDVEARREAGFIGKTKYDKWRKDREANPIGDWQCGYCEYRDKCRQERRAETPKSA